MQKQVWARLLRASRLLTKDEDLIWEIHPEADAGLKWGNGIIRSVLQMDHSGCRVGSEWRCGG